MSRAIIFRCDIHSHRSIAPRTHRTYCHSHSTTCSVWLSGAAVYSVQMIPLRLPSDRSLPRAESHVWLFPIHSHRYLALRALGAHRHCSESGPARRAFLGRHSSWKHGKVPTGRRLLRGELRSGRMDSHFPSGCPRSTNRNAAADAAAQQTKSPPWLLLLNKQYHRGRCHRSAHRISAAATASQL